jgi:bifunctional non-homologous end joining protein LigD
MLATATSVLPTGPDWSFEFKWDGVRALLDVSEHGVTLHSRAGNEVTIAYPELIGPARDAGDALLDGEIVAFVEGRPSFEALQTRMHVRAKNEAARLAHQTPVTFVAFDLLRRFGVDLTARPLHERRATLDRWLGDDPDWTLSPAFGDGAATEAAAREHGLEGVVGKRLGSRYRPGVRSSDWLKLRFVRAGDFVVIGWESPAGVDEQLSSLVLGWYVDGELRYAGKVGSGLTARTSTLLQKRLTPRTTCVLADEPPPSPGRATRWVEPEVVVEVEFTLWTSDGRLRHPVLRGVRPDKTAEEAIGDA